MALAAAVLKAVNSSLYGLSGRVQTVQQAITYLGMREVAGIVLEIGLRAVFPPAAEFEAVVAARRATRRASWGAWRRRCRWMPGPRTRPACSKNAARRCCSAMRPITTARCCARPPTTPSCASSRAAGFGVSHDALGAALCESWGLSAGCGGVRAPPCAGAGRARVAADALKRRSILRAVGAGPCDDDRHRRPLDESRAAHCAAVRASTRTACCAPHAACTSSWRRRRLARR